MSTLAEIEAAVDKLPAAEQKVLLQFIAERVGHSDAVADDPVTAIVRTFPSPSREPNDTGRGPKKSFTATKKPSEAAGLSRHRRDLRTC